MLDRTSSATGDAVDGPENLAIQYKNALVARPNRLDVLLHHGVPRPVARDVVDDRPRISIGLRDHHHTRAASAVERLYDGLSDFGHESMYAIAIAGDQRARHMPGEMQRVELLVRVAKPPRVIHDEHASAQSLEHQRDVEVGGVERRIFPNENAVDLGKANGFGLVERKMRKRVAHSHGTHPRPDVAALHEHVA